MTILTTIFETFFGQLLGVNNEEWDRRYPIRLARTFISVVGVLLLMMSPSYAGDDILPSIEPLDARPKIGSGNTNPLDRRANRNYGNVTARVRKLFSELTLLPEKSFDVVWMPESEPRTMAAMLSDTRMKRAMDANGYKPEARPVLYVAEELLREVDSDDKFEGVLLHEFGHKLEDAQFKKWADAQQKE